MKKAKAAMACIAGEIAQAHYGVVLLEIADMTRRALPKDLLEVIKRFEATYVLCTVELLSLSDCRD